MELQCIKHLEGGDALSEVDESCDPLLLRLQLMHKLPNRSLSLACNWQRVGSQSPPYLQVRLILGADTASMPRSAAAR